MNYFLILLNINNNMQAPITATMTLHILNPVTPDAPMKLNKNPPIKAPTIPTMIFAKAPISEFLPIIMLAIHPDIAPKINHAIYPTIYLLRQTNY